MTRFAHCLACCSLALACTRADDVPALREEAHTAVAEYSAELDQLDTRVLALKKRGSKITEVLPGGDETGRAVVETDNGLIELRRRLADTAAHFADATSEADLRARIDGYRELAEDGLPAGADHLAVPGIPAIGAALSAAESWEAHAETEMSRAGSGGGMIAP